MKYQEYGSIIDQITPIEGEVRAVCKCNICGQLFGRRYIPHGIGRGFTLNPCDCMITNNQHGRFTTVLTVGE